MSLEFIFGIIMIGSGLLALGYVVIAKGKFPEGSELRDIAEKLVVALLFLTCFAVWHVAREYLEWKKVYGEIAEYPEYFFVTIAFLVLLKAAKNLYGSAKKLGIVD